MDFEELFPKRFCMNLDRRPDRLRLAETEFDKAGLTVERQAAIDANRVRNAHGYAWPSRYAVGLTKRIIIRNAKNTKAEGVFIFEDDAVLHPQWRMRCEAIRLPDDCGIFLLGCQHTQPPISVAPGLVKVTAAADNHAIGVRKTWYDRVLYTLRHGREDAAKWPHTASDRHIAALMMEIPTYAAWPNLAWQRVSLSDQTGTEYSLYDKEGFQRPLRHMLDKIEEVWQPGTAPEKLDEAFHPLELDYLRAILKPDMMICEYGAGSLTLSESSRVKTWHTIEHKPNHFRAMSAAASTALIHYVPPGWPHANPFAPALPGQFERYVKHIQSLGILFDVVILNGRARVECALSAAAALKPGGWLFFHDYFARERYLQRAPELQPLYRLVREFRRTPQTMAVFRKRIP